MSGFDLKFMSGLGFNSKPIIQSSADTKAFLDMGAKIIGGGFSLLGGLACNRHGDDVPKRVREFNDELNSFFGPSQEDKCNAMATFQIHKDKASVACPAIIKLLREEKDADKVWCKGTGNFYFAEEPLNFMIINAAVYAGCTEMTFQEFYKAAELSCHGVLNSGFCHYMPTSDPLYIASLVKLFPEQAHKLASDLLYRTSTVKDWHGEPNSPCGNEIFDDLFELFLKTYGSDKTTEMLYEHYERRLFDLRFTEPHDRYLELFKKLDTESVKAVLADKGIEYAAKPAYELKYQIENISAYVRMAKAFNVDIPIVDRIADLIATEPYEMKTLRFLDLLVEIGTSQAFDAIAGFVGSHQSERLSLVAIGTLVRNSPEHIKKFSGRLGEELSAQIRQLELQVGSLAVMKKWESANRFDSDIFLFERLETQKKIALLSDAIYRHGDECGSLAFLLGEGKEASYDAIPALVTGATLSQDPYCAASCDAALAKIL